MGRAGVPGRKGSTDTGRRAGRVGRGSGDEPLQAWIERTGGTVTDIAVMARLFLDPDHRGAGLAGLFILALRHHAQLIGRTVVFDVMAKDAAAVGFYDRSGAERIAEVTHRFGDGLTEPALVYVFPTPLIAG